MKFIKKYIKLIVLIITCIFVYLIYTNNHNIKNINYISLGDGYAKGINSYGEKSYSYSDYMKDEIASNNQLNNYYNYGEEDIKIKDLYNNILINIQHDDQPNIKQALREADILTISIGLNDLIYRKNIYISNVGNANEKIIQNIIIDLDQLITEIKKYYKKDIYLIGYYNFYPQDSVDKKLLDNLNAKYKSYSKRKNIIYIDNSNMNTHLITYLDNPNSYYPNTEGYKKIYSNLSSKINY